MSTDPRKRVYQVDSHTRRIKFDLRRNSLCGNRIRSVGNLTIDVYLEGEEHPDDCILSYDFFDIEADGMLSVVLDRAIVEECPGRYIAYLMHGCQVFDLVRFEIGLRPVLASAPVLVQDSGTDCVASLGELSSEEPLVEPEQCCDDEPASCDNRPNGLGTLLTPFTHCCEEKTCRKQSTFCPDEDDDA